MTSYGWKTIEPLTEHDRKIDLAAMHPIYETWQTSRQRLEESSPVALKEFNQQLVRRLSVETGILERLYDLDRGTTEALVTKGFIEELVSRSSTDLEPSRLIDILEDQSAAIQLVMDCVAGNRVLSRSVIHELHAIFTQHQDTTTAVDQFGKRYEIPLLKGKFKQHPNNPRRPDGRIHEYCPPIHVESEMEKLLMWLSEYHEEDPVIVAAWLHHRFTQIHPYQDGNGRVARALTTLVLLRAKLLPLVIDRDLRTEYIGALEAADNGDLNLLALLFARLERAAILQALSVNTEVETAHQRTLTSVVIESLAEKFSKRRQARHEELRKVNAVAISLRTSAKRTIDAVFNKLEKTVFATAHPDIRLDEGGSDRRNAHWYKFEVATSATKAGVYVNFVEDHYFLKASIRVERERLVFVTSFHHIGRELSGIMEVTAFAQLVSYEDSEDRESSPPQLIFCSLEPFVFTYKTKEDDITTSFTRWLDTALAVAIKEYGDRL